MTQNRDIHEEIMREYEATRERSKAILEETKKHIYIRFPRLLEIDAELGKVALLSCKDILDGKAKDHEKIVKDMEKKTKSLIKERADILKSAGLPEDCLSESFNCALCKDTGWKNGEKCECYREKMQRIMHKRSNIRAEKMPSFEKFDLSLYPDTPDEDYGISPKDNAKNILESAIEFTKAGSSLSKQMLFYGNTGLGKTFTSECIAKEFIKNGKDVFYTSAPKLFTIFEDYRFGKNTSDEAKKTIEFISDVELLIIDDLGTEFRTQYVDSILFDIINTRTSENKYLIISTNLTPGQLEETYSPRISSRILGNFETVLFLGRDLRIG